MKSRLIELSIYLLTNESISDLRRMRQVNLRGLDLPGKTDRPVGWDDIGWEQIRKIRARVIERPEKKRTCAAGACGNQR